MLKRIKGFLLVGSVLALVSPDDNYLFRSDGRDERVSYMQRLASL